MPRAAANTMPTAPTAGGAGYPASSHPAAAYAATAYAPAYPQTAPVPSAFAAGAPPAYPAQAAPAPARLAAAVVAPTKEKKSFLQMELTPKRVKREDVMHLSRQLGAFIRAGLPLIEAVRILGEEATNTTLRRLMVEVEEGLRHGETLSDCLARPPRVSPDFSGGILRSAELPGQLDPVLARLANSRERARGAPRRIKAPSIYPAMIAGMA